MDKCINAGCKFPDCSCVVPDYALSHEKRAPYCQKVKEIKTGKTNHG